MWSWSRARTAAAWGRSSRPYASASRALARNGESMLTWLADVPALPNAFHVFRYLTFRAMGAAGTGLFLVFFFGPAIISALRLKQGKGQPIRLDGPASHILAKKGTPTMGGLMILFGLVVSSLLWASLESPYVWIVLFVTAGFAAIGFYDDYLKVTKQSHLGFSARARLSAEYVIAALACFALMRVGGAGASSLAVPFVNGYIFDFGWGFLLFGPFVIVAFGNAVNLTDGLDGLAIVPVMIAAATLGLIAYIAGNVLRCVQTLEDGRILAGEIPARFEDVHLVQRQVVHALQPLAHPDRPGQRGAGNAQHRLDFVQQLDRRTALAVELVDEGHDRGVAQPAHLHQLDRALLHAFGAVDHHQRRIHRSQHAVGVLGEVRVSGRVEQVDDLALVRELHHRRSHRNAALLFQRHPVRRGVPRRLAALHRAGHLDRAAEQQQLLGQRGLARVRVADDGKGAATAGFLEVGGHGAWVSWRANRQL